MLIRIGLASAAFIALVVVPSPAAATLAFMDRTESFEGALGLSSGLPPSIGDVTITFESQTFRSGGYGGTDCFARTLTIEDSAPIHLQCDPWQVGCGWRSQSIVVDADTFNAWLDGGVSLSMNWTSAQCGLAWSIRYEYPFEGIDRRDFFVGATGESSQLPPASSDVWIEFSSNTFQPYDPYGGGNCLSRTLWLEDGSPLSLACVPGGCAWTSATALVPQEVFNAWRQDGVDLSMQWQSANCGLWWSIRYVYGTLGDCNDNAREDELDVAIGTSPDCNSDGVPDECQGLQQVVRTRAPSGPFGAGLPASVTFSDLPPSLGLVELTVRAVADLDSAIEVVIPILDGIQQPPLFAVGGKSCGSGENVGSILLSSSQFLALIPDGSLTIQMVASTAVNPYECPVTWLSLELRYVGETASADCDQDGVIDLCRKGGIIDDCNGNGVDDACDLASGFDTDCNLDGSPDGCQILSDPSIDKNFNLVLDACEIARGDLDLDGDVGGSDLTILLSLWGLSGPFVPDLDGDGVVGPTDLAILLGNWGTIPSAPCGNGVPNAFEDCFNCPSDVDCGPSARCLGGLCIPCSPVYGGYGGYAGYGGGFGNGTCGGYLATGEELLDYRHQPGGALDTNFRHFTGLPLPSFALASCAVLTLSLGLVRLRR